MSSKFSRILKNRSIQGQNLEVRLGILFLVSGFLLSILATILTLSYSYGFWIVFPNGLMALVCILIPVFSKNIKKSAYIALILVGLFYYPFIFSIAGGVEGPAPIYFLVIIVYTSLYFRGKKVIYLDGFFVIYFVLIVLIANRYPQFINANNINFLKSIDIIISVVSVSIVISFVTIASFTVYRQEYQVNEALMKELEARNEELKILSTKDHLTNVYNRRYFF